MTLPSAADWQSSSGILDFAGWLCWSYIAVIAKWHLGRQVQVVEVNYKDAIILSLSSYKQLIYISSFRSIVI